MDRATFHEASSPVTADNMPASRAAQITVLSNDRGCLTKKYTRRDDGTVQKAAAANLVRGTFGVVYASTLEELDAVLDGLAPHQAVTYGRPAADAGEIVARSVSDKPDAISRTREHFSFVPGTGVLMLDYDPPKDGDPLTPDQLVDAIRKSVPAMADVAMLWRASSSSGVEGASIQGQRLYVLIDDATAIPRVGAVVFDRLWLAGYGYYVLSKSGQFLERAPIDAAVFQPERLDFAAPPVLDAGVTRTIYPSQIYLGANAVVQASSIQDPTSQEKAQLKEIKRAARSALDGQATQVRDEFCREMAEVLAARYGKEEPDEWIQLHVKRAVNERLLMGDWELTTSTGAKVTVGDMLDNPSKWHNTRCADPVELDDDLRVAWVNLRSGGRPFLYSHKHGGVRYILERAPALIQLQAGQLPEHVDALVEILAKGGDLFTHAEGVVYVNDECRIVVVKAPWFTVHAQRFVRFEKYDKRNNCWVPTGCPPEVTNGVLALASRNRLPKLTAVRTAPTMDVDGRVISAPGHDEKTGLLLIPETVGTWPAVPHAPSRDQLKQALDALWKPFARFPYADKEDASVALAAIITTAVRACVPTSPGFGFSATAPGTGKTLLAQCIGLLYDGKAPGVSSPIVQEEEWAKALFSAVIGGESTLLFDNAEQGIESASLCAAITSPSLKGRVLGESRTAMAEHRLLIMATGNGLRLVGDLNRRFLVCRLDARMEAADIVARRFDLNPLAYCAEHRVELQVAALTLIRGYAAAGFPRVCDSLSSFEDWNKLVRSTIVWLIKQGIAMDFVDPIKALQRDAATDPDAAQLQALIENLKSIWGIGGRFSVADIIDKRCAAGYELGPVLEDIAGERGDINRKRLGRWLDTREGRVVNGLALVRDGKNRSGSVMWKLKTQG